MATKSKTFKSDHDGPITVTVPGHSVIALDSGKSLETDDAVVIAALTANPDVSEVKGKK